MFFQNFYNARKVSSATGNPNRAGNRSPLRRSTTLATLVVQPKPSFAASHREAPITALDHKADIADWFAFVSPEHPDRAVLILNRTVSRTQQRPELLSIRPQRTLRVEGR
jgi:hypothetical protein